MTSLVVQSLDLARDESVSLTLTVCAAVGVVLADDLARVESLSVYSLDVAVRDHEDPDNPARAIRLRRTRWTR